MKNKLTKAFAVLVVAAMVLALTGCPDGIKDKAGTYTTQSSLEQILADGELKGIDLAKLTWKPVTEEFIAGTKQSLGLVLDPSGKLLAVGMVYNFNPEEDNGPIPESAKYCIVNNKAHIMLVTFVTESGEETLGLIKK